MKKTLPSRISIMKCAASIFLLVAILYSNSYTYGNNIGGEPFLTELRARGFSLIPSPQHVELGDDNIIVDGSWVVDSRVGKEDMAFKRLVSGAKELHQLAFGNNGSKKIILEVKPGSVKGTDDTALNKQGYQLRITPELVEITGNDGVGLFYGVQSFLQLLRRDPMNQRILPEGIIQDWPALQLRFVHWDTKHHQKRMETMKRLIDWHAYFKVNMIAFEMEDKYEYPSHPIIGAPGAYTKAEMQELTRYASERYIQIVPDVQSPAHMAYVLKHEEFAHLRSDGSNYQACLCDPEAIDLIFDMYQDMIDATPGVDYFLVSTDELYYAGICGKCKDPYNDESRSQAWIDFANKAHDWMAKRGRRMISWVEYPLVPNDILKLPGDLINGVGGREYAKEEQEIGMQVLVYSSTQGAEYLFPNHFFIPSATHKHPDRITSISHAVKDIIAKGVEPLGTFAAAWDDSGLHEETFHLGWATVTQYGWTPNWPTAEQNVADFMDVFYGQSSPDMTAIYYQLIEGAQFYSTGWDKVTSTERGPGYGNSNGKGVGTRRTDDILTIPEIPEKGTLEISPVFSESYSELISRAEILNYKNEILIKQLNRYIGQVERNRYNLEVFLSIAYLQRYFIKTVLTLNNAETLLLRANKAANDGKYAVAVANMVEASNDVGSLIRWGNWMWGNLTEVWEKSRYEKGRSVNGKEFVHVLDDVKDHWADRRTGLDYMIAPFQRLKLTEWHRKLNERVNGYAENHNVPVSGLEEVRLED